MIRDSEYDDGCSVCGIGDDDFCCEIGDGFWSGIDDDFWSGIGDDFHFANVPFHSFYSIFSRENENDFETMTTMNCWNMLSACDGDGIVQASLLSLFQYL